MMGWSDAKTIETVHDHLLKRNNHANQPIREAYNPFESNSPYAVAAIAKGETNDSQPRNFDNSNTLVKTNSTLSKLEKFIRGNKRRRFK